MVVSAFYFEIIIIERVIIILIWCVPILQCCYILRLEMTTSTHVLMVGTSRQPWLIIVVVVVFSYFYFRGGWATRPAAGGRVAPQWGGEEERGECHANKPIIEGYWALPVNLRPSSHGQTEADTNKWDSSLFFSRGAHRPSPGSTFFLLDPATFFFFFLMDFTSERSFWRL